MAHLVYTFAVAAYVMRLECIRAFKRLLAKLHVKDSKALHPGTLCAHLQQHVPSPKHSIQQWRVDSCADADEALQSHWQVTTAPDIECQHIHYMLRQVIN